jgi:hypothetical protein
MPTVTRLAKAFAASRYEVAGAVLRVGGRRGVDALLARLRAREAALLTAWNPLGRRRPEGANRHAQRALDTALHHVATLPAASGLGAWREEMRAVALPWARALRLARRFRQAAILALRRGAPARLLWCRP